MAQKSDNDKQEGQMKTKREQWGSDVEDKVTKSTQTKRRKLENNFTRVVIITNDNVRVNNEDDEGGNDKNTCIELTLLRAGYLMGPIVCAHDNATSTGSRRSGAGRRTHCLPEGWNALIVVVEVEARERSVQVVDSVLPIELATAGGQSSSRRITMSRSVVVLPTRRSREELVGRNVEEGSITWCGRPSSRARSGSRSDRRSFTTQWNVGWIFTNGGGETLVWPDPNGFLGGLKIIDVHPKVRREWRERRGKRRTQVLGLDRTNGLVPVVGKHVDRGTDALVIPERNITSARWRVQPSHNASIGWKVRLR